MIRLAAPPLAGGLALALLAGAPPGAASPDTWFPPRSHELALQSDVIAIGTIVAIDFTAFASEGDTFAIRVDELVSGEVRSAQLRVHRAEPGRRHPFYEVGQRSLFHLVLERDAQGVVLPDEPLRVMGAGNEGECPLAGDDLVHQAFEWEDVEAAKHEAFGHALWGVAAPAEEYAAAVAGLRALFRWDRGERRDTVFPSSELRQLGAPAAVAELEASSHTAARLVRGVRRTQDRLR